MKTKKTYKIILLALAVLAFNGNVLLSQSTGDDQITIHSNKSFCITGETYKYKVYLPKSFTSQEKIIRSCLLSSDNKLISEAFHNNNQERHFTGAIKIPIDLPSGVYHLILSSYHVQQQEEIKLAEIHIPVYSDLLNDLKISPNTSTPEHNKNLITTNVDIDIQFDSNPPSRRSRVNGKIIFNDASDHTIDESCDLSLSVHDSQLNIRSLSTVHYFTVDNTIVEGLSNKIYMNGTIRSTDKNKKKKFPVMSIYAQQENKFYYLQTDSAGFFNFNAENFLGQKKLQFVNYDNEEFNVEIHRPKVANDTPTLAVTEEIIELLKQSRKRKKINRLFNLALEDQNKEQPNWSKAPIKYSQEYVLDNYEAFKDISTFFDEVLSGLKFRKQDKQNYTARVFNRERASRGFYKGDPVFVIDGIVTKDAQFVHDLDFNKVDTINLVADLKTLRSTYGPIGLNGMIYMNTSLPEIKLSPQKMKNIIALNGIQNIKEGSPLVATEIPNATPLFSPSVTWKYNLTKGTDGSYQFEFIHTDDIGEFQIELVGRKSNGELIRATKNYTIK